MLQHRGTPLLLLIVVLASCGLLAQQPGATVAQQQTAKAVQAEDHPEIDDQWETCDNCHADVTPDIVDAWYASHHGINNVKCFMCHGSAGKDFVTQPGTVRCASCHNDWVESMATDFMAGKSCFSCHTPHALNPHKVAD